MAHRWNRIRQCQLSVLLQLPQVALRRRQRHLAREIAAHRGRSTPIQQSVILQELLSGSVSMV